MFSRVSLPILKPGRAELPNLPPLPMTRPTNILPIARPLDAAGIPWRVVPGVSSVAGV